jgi:hypothetical protein
MDRARIHEGIRSSPTTVASGMSRRASCAERLVLTQPKPRRRTSSGCSGSHRHSNLCRQRVCGTTARGKTTAASQPSLHLVAFRPTCVTEPTGGGLLPLGIDLPAPVGASVIATAAGKPIYFRTLTTDDYRGPGMARFLCNTFGVKSGYVLDDSGAYGVGLAEAFVTGARSAGMTISGRDSLDPKHADYTATLTKIKAMGPQALALTVAQWRCVIVLIRSGSSIRNRHAFAQAATIAS